MDKGLGLEDKQSGNDEDYGTERLSVVLAEYSALRDELMFFINSIELTHQLTWALMLAEIGALVYIEKLETWLLCLAYVFGAPFLVIMLLLKSAAGRSRELLLADYIHKGIKRQIHAIIGSHVKDGIPLFDWEEHKARTRRVGRRFLKILDILSWGIFLVAFVVSYVLGLYIGIRNDFFGWNGLAVAEGGFFMCAFGVLLSLELASQYNVIDTEARRPGGRPVPQEKNRFRYAVGRLDTAKKIILTPQGETKTHWRWRDETIGVLELCNDRIPSGGVVLDFGMGIGRILKALAEKRPDVRLIGIDSTPEMRKLAKEDLPHGRCKLLRDMRSVAPESVDFAFAIYVLQHVSPELLDVAIDDLYYALKPGGSLLVIDGKVRFVPFELDSEKNAFKRGKMAVDEAILQIAECDPMGAWVDDHISVLEKLERRFGMAPEYLSPNPKLFCYDVISKHSFVVFKKELPSRPAPRSLS